MSFKQLNVSFNIIGSVLAVALASGCLPTITGGDPIFQVVPQLAFTSPTLYSQVSGTVVATGVCTATFSGTVNLVYNSHVSGPASVHCDQDAFSVSVTTDRTAGQATISATQSSSSGNTLQTAVNFASLTEFIEIPKNTSGFSAIVANSYSALFATGSGSTATVYAGTGSGLSISHDGGITYTTRTISNGLGSNTINAVFAFGNGLSSTVYVATAGGLSVSTDGGNSYVNRTTADGLMNNAPNGVFAVAGAPAPTVYVTSGGGLSISTDGGVTFTTQFVEAFGMKAPFVIGSGPTANVYAIGGSIFTQSIMVSNDGGLTFPISNNVGAFKSASSIYPLSAGPAGMLLVTTSDTNDSLGNSINGGATLNLSPPNPLPTMTPLPSPFPFGFAPGIYGVASNFVYGADGANAPIYVATNIGLFASTDGGYNFGSSAWRTTANGLGSNNISRVFSLGSGATGSLYVGTNSGLSISNDAGNTFTNHVAQSGLPSAGIGSVNAVDIAGKAYLFVATGSGLGISTDGGATFTNRTTANGLGSNSTRRIFVTQNGGSTTVYVATTAGLSISTDLGTTFTNLNMANTPTLPSNNIYFVYVNGTGTIYLATQAGLAISSDGGTTFTTATTANGLGSNIVIGGLYVSPNGTIYVGTNGAGLSISTDGGANFTTVNVASGTGLLSDGFSNLYGSGNGTLYIATGAGLSISTDGGATFTTATMANGLAANNIKAVAVISGGATPVIYAATQTAGLSVSTDGGATFTGKSAADGIGSVNLTDVFAFSNGGVTTVYVGSVAGLFARMP